MKKSKFISVAICVFYLLLSKSDAAALFYSFDDAQNGNGNFTSAVTANDGFGSPTSVAIAGSQNTTDPNGGEASYTDFEGNTWIGSGSYLSPGHSLQWKAGSTNNSFSLTVGTLGLTDLSVRLAARDAQSTGNLVGGFSDFTYDVGGGEVNLGAGTSFNTNNTFTVWEMDLSSVSAIENQSTVTLKWTIPTIGGGSSFRVDNIEFAAVPEPTSVLLMVLGISGLVLLQRRR
ncbi:PEP-CTERM sorting domain-containing protein [Kiritimatiellaeota bacterium B1221]|nr:PEP-CTERM sorting domain-containing protein [Kiritimatiellaeota bacterium B1221]